MTAHHMYCELLPTHEIMYGVVHVSSSLYNATVGIDTLERCLDFSFFIYCIEIKDIEQR